MRYTDSEVCNYLCAIANEYGGRHLPGLDEAITRVYGPRGVGATTKHLRSVIKARKQQARHLMDVVNSHQKGKSE